MTDQELKDLVASLAIAQANTDAQLAKTDAQLAKTDAKLNRIAEMYGGIANNNGYFAEDSFAAALERNPRLGELEFDEVSTRWKGRHNGQDAEFDIVLLNGERVGLVEVKYRLTPSDVKKFAERTIPLFRQMFSEYATAKIYGGVAGLSYSEGAVSEARERGLFALAADGMDLRFINDSVRAY